MGQTAVEKIAQAHMTAGPAGRPLRAGDFLSVRPKHVMTHDNTSAVMIKFRAIGAAGVHDSGQPVITLDHDIQNRSETNLAKYRSIEGFARKHGVAFHPAGSGIGHQLMIDGLYVTPGALVVASDSHANMYGAMGAVGTPVVRTDAAAIWASGEFWWQIPRTVQVVLENELPEGATGKDVILMLCSVYNRREVLNAAVEFAGRGVASLSMEERQTISNMTTEWGALVGWFPVDETTFRFIESRRAILAARGADPIADAQVAAWRSSPPAPDPGAEYAARITLDLSRATPHVSGPDSVQIAMPLSELAKEKIEIHKAYLVSCVNSRLSDIEAAARVVEGKRIADGVEFYMAAASREIQDEAEKRGFWKTLLEAGARPLPPGCGPCIGLGAGLLEPGEVGISATNRNFKGRMGSREARCYLASPAVVAASAVAGQITGPGSTDSRPLATSFVELPKSGAEAERVKILPGFPESIRGRLVFLPQDNLNTDGIYGKEYTYREDVTPETMAEVVMANYDPEFAGRTREGDVIVGGFNFGSGSSREQAVTAIQAKGIALLIAGSFSQTYLRNAFNNGFACIECPTLVARAGELFAEEVGRDQRTVIPGDEIEVDFAAARVEFRGEDFRFAPLGEVPQSLVVAGGIENQVRQRLGL